MCQIFFIFIWNFFFFSLLSTTPSFLLFLLLKKILGPPFHLEALDNYLIRLVEGLALVTAYLTIPNLWFGGTTRSVQQITWLTDLSAYYRDVEIWMVDFCHTQLLVKGLQIIKNYCFLLENHITSSFHPIGKCHLV